MNKLAHVVDSFKDRNILLIGDTILDIYHYGKALRLSLETPTIVGKEEHSEVSFGGAALVARNILELGGKVSFISLWGDDAFAHYENDFAHKNLDKIFFKEVGRPITVKERFWCDGYKLLQWNHLDASPVSLSLEDHILELVKKKASFFHKLVIADYQNGLLTPRLAAGLIKIMKKFKKPVYVDSQISPRGTNYEFYKGADLLCLNAQEAKSAHSSFNDASLQNSLLQISKKFRVPQVILKRGERGSVALFHGEYVQTPAFKVQAVDTTGAGDAFLGAISLCGARLLSHDFRLANVWAGLSTATMGAHPPSLTQFLKSIKEA